MRSILLVLKPPSDLGFRQINHFSYPLFYNNWSEHLFPRLVSFHLPSIRAICSPSRNPQRMPSFRSAAKPPKEVSKKGLFRESVRRLELSSASSFLRLANQLSIPLMVQSSSRASRDLTTRGSRLLFSLNAASSFSSSLAENGFQLLLDFVDIVSRP